VPSSTVFNIAVPIEAWSIETRTLISSSFPDLELLEVDPTSDLSEVALEGASILILEAKTKAHTDNSLKIIQRLSEKIKKKTLAIALLTNCENSNEEISKLEISGMIQVLSPLISAKALKLKIDFLFAKMKAAQNVISISPRLPALEKTENGRSIVLISPRSEDLRLVSQIAVRSQSSFHYYHQIDGDLTNFLNQHPEAIVFLDVDSEQATEKSSPHWIKNISDIVSKKIACSQIFAISDKNISRLPHVSSEDIRGFSHNLLRGESEAAFQVYATMVERAICQSPFDIESYFDENSKSQVFTISQASHRTTAVLGVERFLIECGLLHRIAVQAARAVDELILKCDAGCSGRFARSALSARFGPATEL
jgi:hypothetical protein